MVFVHGEEDSWGENQNEMTHNLVIITGGDEAGKFPWRVMMS